MSHYKNGNTLVVAHYYTTPEVQAMADLVADSLALSQFIDKKKADRVVFAGVKFMAETAKIISPTSQIILPHKDSTCSLVTQTNLADVQKWIDFWRSSDDGYPVMHVSYINSSAEQKAISDWIVTSANAEEIITDLIGKGFRVLFSPDRNMGAYLAYAHPEWGGRLHYWSSVCEVHDLFKEKELDKAFKTWTDGPKYLIAHPESPLPILKRANMVGSTTKMINFVKDFVGDVGTIYVATESNLLYNMKELRPDLDIRLAPMYTGCQCNVCPYIQLNTPENVQAAIDGTAGVEIDYLSQEIITLAKVPIQRMLNFTI